jgi:hypothetical protein
VLFNAASLQGTIFCPEFYYEFTYQVLSTYRILKMTNHIFSLQCPLICRPVSLLVAHSYFFDLLPRPSCLVQHYTTSVIYMKHPPINFSSILPYELIFSRNSAEFLNHVHTAHTFTTSFCNSHFNIMQSMTSYHK